MFRFIPIPIVIILLPAVGLAAPAVSVPQVHFDFGVVAQGVRLEHDFEVENSGDEDLVINVNRQVNNLPVCF